MTLAILTPKEYRRFMRRMRASDQKPFLKTGCDTGLYDHFKGPTPTPKLHEAKALIDKLMHNCLED